MIILIVSTILGLCGIIAPENFEAWRDAMRWEVVIVSSVIIAYFFVIGPIIDAIRRRLVNKQANRDTAYSISDDINQCDNPEDDLDTDEDNVVILVNVRKNEFPLDHCPMCHSKLNDVDTSSRIHPELFEGLDIFAETDEDEINPYIPGTVSYDAWNNTHKGEQS